MGLLRPFTIKQTPEVVYMAKKPNSKPKKPVKQDESMVNAMKFFVVGFVAELYLMIIRRGYVNGTANQQIAWYDNHLKTLLFVGIAVLAVGAVLAYMWRQNKKTRVYGWIIAGFGAFVSASSALVHWNMSSLTMLSTLVPVVMASSTSSNSCTSTRIHFNIMNHSTNRNIFKW